MTLRNKPGLSIVLRNSVFGIECAGWIVRVLYLAPRTPFLLPDGQLVGGSEAPGWVIELPREVTLPGLFPSRFSVAIDIYMRPIDPGDDSVTDESVRDLYQPESITA